MKQDSIISIQGGRFVDSLGRPRTFRGVTLSSCNKEFCPPATDKAATFFADLKKIGVTLLRWQICWEDIEGAGPDSYDEAYLADLRFLLKKAEEAGMLVFVEPLMENWGTCTGGSGAPEWTMEAAGLDATVAATTTDVAVTEKRQAQTMFNLFWAGKKLAAQKTVEGENVQDYLQNHYIAAMKHTARRIKDCKTVLGFGIMAEGKGVDQATLENLGLNFEDDCLKPFQKKFIAAFQKKHGHYLFLAQQMTTGQYSRWKFLPGFQNEEARTVQKEGGVIPDGDPEASKVITLLKFSAPRKTPSILFSKNKQEKQFRDKLEKQFQDKIKEASGGGNALMADIAPSQGYEVLQELVQEAGLSYFLNKKPM